MDVGRVSHSTSNLPIGGSSSADATKKTSEAKGSEGLDVEGLQTHSMKSGDVSGKALKISDKIAGGTAKALPMISSALAKCTVGAGDFLLNNSGAIIGVIGKIGNFIIETGSKALDFLGIETIKIPTCTFWI